MKKSLWYSLAVLVLATVFVSCEPTINPGPKEGDASNVLISGTYTNSDGLGNCVYVYKNGEANYTTIQGSRALLFENHADLYLLVSKPAATELYKNDNLVATIPFLGQDFFVHEGVTTVVGAATLDGAYPTAPSQMNAVTFNTASEQITFLDANDNLTSEATYITRLDNKYYMGGKAFLTSPVPKLMSWIEETYTPFYGPSVNNQITMYKGKFVSVGTKVLSAGKSVVIQSIDSVETVLTDTSEISSAKVVVSKVIDVYASDANLYIAATQTIDGTQTMKIWKNGQLASTMPSTIFVKMVEKNGAFYFVSRGIHSNDPYTISCDGKQVGILPSEIVTVDDIN